MPMGNGGGPEVNKRKKTLQSLLAALEELSNDDKTSASQTLEGDKGVPTTDEHLQNMGAESFNVFERRVLRLDRELWHCFDAAHHLGNAEGILSSVVRLRGCLAEILYSFRENASDLFPRKVQRRREMGTIVNNIQSKRRHRSPAQFSIPQISAPVDPEDLPDNLQKLSQEFNSFLDTLNDYFELPDEAVNTAIDSLMTDLKYWSSCLRSYEGQLRYPAVQRYVHDLSLGFGEHLENVTTVLTKSVEAGVQKLQSAQARASSTFLNVSTVAALLSAVTATMIQFSYGQTDTPLENSVNGFWFTSLVFSIGAAVNSLLGVTWKQSMNQLGSSGHTVAWWVHLWTKRAPLAFLMLSVPCFSMGLVLFAYSSHQHHITSIITTAFSAFTGFGLSGVSLWFLAEKWRLRKQGTQAQAWPVLLFLGDYWSDISGRLSLRTAWLVTKSKMFASSTVSWMRRQCAHLSTLPRRVSRSIRDSSRTRRQDLECVSDEEPKSPTDSHALTPMPSHPLPQITIPSQDSVPLQEDVLSNIGDSGPSTEVSDVTRTARNRWKNAVRTIMSVRSASSQSFQPSLPRRRQNTTLDIIGRAQVNPVMMNVSRVATLVPRLRAMEVVLDIAAHQALVRHMQFSPDGRFLATSSWDRTCAIFRVDRSGEVQTHRILAHPTGFVGQVIWSPNGDILLTRTPRGMKVWSSDNGVCKRTIDRFTAVQAVAWHPNGRSFFSAEGDCVTLLDMQGKVQHQDYFDHIALWDIAAMHDGQRLICVGTLKFSPDGLLPSRCRPEKQIIVYNLNTHVIESRIPVLAEIRTITTATSCPFVLVSYEDKAPPQLWKLEQVRDQARLALRHTYLPKVNVDFIGRSYFGGDREQLVVCAGKPGDIFVWDAESAALLHHIRHHAAGRDLTCVAWNGAAKDPFMFATGSHDGAVSIWSTPPEPADAQPQEAIQPPDFRTWSSPPSPPAILRDPSDSTDNGIVTF